jgi:phytochelatin synthase
MPRLRRWLIAVGLVVAIAGGAIAVVPPLLWRDGVDYSKVVSIKTTPEYQDARLLERAWALPVAQHYRNVDFQKNGSFCGPTSVVNVMHSLDLPAEQSTVLDGVHIRTFFGIIPGGVTLDQLAIVLGKRTGRSVQVLRDLDLPHFREHMRHANDPSRRYIVNFHRGPLFGTGVGHHSPVAAYLEPEDLVLVADVNRKYQPWLVKTERLFEAVDTIDKSSHKKRGLLLIE